MAPLYTSDGSVYLGTRAGTKMERGEKDRTWRAFVV